jgi:primosomal protein N' (replication factor Y)
VWTALPGLGDDAWPAALAVVALVAAAAGRGVLAVLPDHRDVDRLVAALAGHGAADQVVRLTADAGPARRYTAFLRSARGQARIVVGTRAAALAPVRDLGLVVCWDDGDDLHGEPRAPYPHARDVLRLRADQTRAAAVLGGYTRSVEGELLLREGWARPLVAARPTVRTRVPRVVVSGDDDLRDPAARTARLPSLALRAARGALGTGRTGGAGGTGAGGVLGGVGPVLVQVPRAGYVPALACQGCRAPATCRSCHGPLARRSPTAPPACAWCGRPAVDWTCRLCGSGALRSVRVGVGRTAEELGRALPGVPVRVSGGATGVLPDVGPEPALVVATPGAEPWADGGYAAALLLDGWALLARPDLRAGEEALRRWAGAAALVRPTGQVVLVAESSLSPVQALVRWDGPGFAARELAERTHLGLPPAALLAEVVGPAAGVDALRSALRLPPGVEVLGPVQVEAAPGPPPPTGSEPEPHVRLLLRAALSSEPVVVAALAAARRVLSAAKVARPPRVRVRPAVVD